LVVSESKPNFKQKVTSSTPHRNSAIDKKTKWLIGLAFLSVILNLSELKFLPKSNTNPNDLYNKGQYSAALPLYQLQAELGNAHAQVMLSLMYSRGQGAAKDYTKAVYWSKNAAEQGNAGLQV